MITLQQIKSWRPCYESEAPGTIDRLAHGRAEFTLQEVLAAAHNDTDRVWVITRPGVLTRPQMLEWLARLAERALARVESPDPRSVAVVAALRADLVTSEIRRAAYDAVSAAAAYADAAAAAQRAQQVRDALELTDA